MELSGILRLPREVRQQILFSTYTGHTSLEQLTWISWIEEFRKVRLRVISLRNVHPTITEDMIFVAARWRERLQILCNEMVGRVSAQPSNWKHLLEAWKLEGVERAAFGITPGPVHFRNLYILKQATISQKMWKDIAAAGNAAKLFENLLQTVEARRGRYERHGQELRSVEALWRNTLARMNEEEGIVVARMQEIVKGLIELEVMNDWPEHDRNLLCWKKEEFFEQPE